MPGKNSFAIKRPDARRRSFAVVEVRPDGQRSTLKLESLDAVNAQLLAGALSREAAEKQVRAILAGLYAERDRTLPQDLFHSENLQLLDRYWMNQYQDRDLVDPGTMKADLRRAVAAVGHLSLLAAGKPELQTALNARFVGKPSLQRRAAARLNQLLHFAGRGFTLRMVRLARSEPRFLTLDELEQVLPRLPPPMQALARVAWVTGLRVGEAFALTDAALKQDCLLVATQLDVHGVRRETKTRSVRKVAYLHPDGEAWVRQFLALPDAVRAALRTERHSVLMRRACKKAFPGVPAKHCHLHDLRHSYAVALVQRGVPISLVAQSLGNSVAVCERYYSGYALVDEGIATIARILGRN